MFLALLVGKSWGIYRIYVRAQNLPSSNALFLGHSVYHEVVIYGEDTYRKKVVFHLSVLKPEAEMVSEASRGCYDLDKHENITNLYRQSNRTNWKKQRHQELSETMTAGLKAQDPASCWVLSPIVWHKICWYLLKLKSLSFKPTTQKT